MSASTPLIRRYAMAAAAAARRGDPTLFTRTVNQLRGPALAAFLNHYYTIIQENRRADR